MTPQSRAGTLFVAPVLVAIALVFLLPSLAALALSLTDFDIYALADIGNLRVVGLANYAALLGEPLFWRACRNTALFALIGVPGAIGASLGAALLLSSATVRWKPLWRALLFAPYVSTLVATAFVWRYLLDARTGLLNRGLAAIGLPAIDWLGDPRASIPAITIFVVWKVFGYNMVVFTSALAAVPRDLHEAALLDGAGRWLRFRHVVLPAIGPTLLLAAVLSVAGFLQLFTEPWVMTQGGPAQSTVTLLYFMIDQGFKWWSLGTASAVAVLLFLATLAITLVQVGIGAAVRMDLRRVLPTALASVLALVIALPLIWMVSVSLMPPGSAAATPPPLWPMHPTLFNYRDLLFGRVTDGVVTSYHIVPAILNSLALAVLSTLLSLVLTVPAGYAFARLRFAGREALLRLLVAAVVVPGQVAMLPLFLMLRAVGLVDSYAGVLAPGLAGIFAVLFVRQATLAIPEEMLDAARLDGASEMRIFTHIVVPLLVPVIVTIALFSFLASWNDFLWPLIVLTDRDLYTLPVALAGMSREHAGDTELMMAGSVVTTMPVLLIFAALQRFYFTGVLGGSVKG